MGGKESKFMAEKKKAAGSKASEYMLGCMEKAKEDKEARKTCNVEARKAFEKAGGDKQEYNKMKEKAAKDEAASLMTSCYKDAGCTMSDKGKRTCTDKKL